MRTHAHRWYTRAQLKKARSCVRAISYCPLMCHFELWAQQNAIFITDELHYCITVRLAILEYYWQHLVCLLAGVRALYVCLQNRVSDVGNIFPPFHCSHWLRAPPEAMISTKNPIRMAFSICNLRSCPNAYKNKWRRHGERLLRFYTRTHIHTYILQTHMCICV